MKAKVKTALQIALATLVLNPYLIGLHAQEGKPSVTESISVAEQGDTIPVVVPSDPDEMIAQVEEVVPSDSPFLHDGDDQLLSTDVPDPVVREDDSPSDAGKGTQKKSWWSRAKEKVSTLADNSVEWVGHKFEEHKFAKKYGKYNLEDKRSYLFMTMIEDQLAQADDMRDLAAMQAAIEADERQRLFEESVRCLQLNGYYESRGESAHEEYAANATVLNRLSVGYRGATTVCEVVFSPAQYSWTKTHGMEIPNFKTDEDKFSWERSGLLARRMMDADAEWIDPSNGSIYYYNPSVATPNWAKDYREVVVHGNHRFMEERSKNHKYYVGQGPRINPVLLNGLSAEEREAAKKAFTMKGD